MGDWCTGALEELAGKLAGPRWEQAVEAAARANEWFLPAQVETAVAALRDEMLCPEKLIEWLAAYRKPEGWQPKRVGIVAAGNLPLVGFADLAAIVAIGHGAVVKPSSKDRPLMEFVIEKLRESGCGIEIVAELRPNGLDGVIATGGDAARDYFEREFTGIPSLLRGSRQSVAVLTGREGDEELKGLAEDMFLYWGLGCRSVVRLFVPEGYDVTTLVAVLSRFGPQAHPKYGECYRYARAMAAMSGDPWVDGDSFVLRRVADDAGPVAPRLAEVLWSEYDTDAGIAGWLARYEEAVQCAAGVVPASFPRGVALGRTQRPGWKDYADGVDTVEFLLGLG